MQKKKVEYKFDIFSLLDKVNKKNISYISSLSEEDKKHINPYMIMRWMSGSSSPTQIIWLNELLNHTVWGILPDHNKEDHFNIKMFLLTICGTGKSSRFTWIKSKSDKKHPFTIKVLKEYFNYNTKDAEEVFQILKSEDIIDYAEQLGYQTDDLKKLKKEFG